jgi:Uma2 family endonuclease
MLPSSTIPVSAPLTADLLRRLGDVPPERVRLHPSPGTATEKDLAKLDKPLCELVDGVLVEKPMGYVESLLAMLLGHFLWDHVRKKDLGIVLGADGAVRMMPGLVRVPDLSFVSWKRLPGRVLPTEPIPGLVPDLAVEVLSESNTPAEMKRKLGEYFQAGVRLVWYVDPKARTVRVYHAPERSTLIPENGTLKGAKVLPGFALPLTELFALVPRAEEPA